jgi:hypothetical protein
MNDKTEICKTLKDKSKTICVIVGGGKYGIKYLKDGKPDPNVNSIGTLLQSISSEGLEPREVDETMAWVRRAISGEKESE